MRAEILMVSKNGDSLCITLKPEILAEMGLKYRDRVILQVENGVARFTKLAVQGLAAELAKRGGEGKQ